GKKLVAGPPSINRQHGVSCGGSVRYRRRGAGATEPTRARHRSRRPSLASAARHSARFLPIQGRVTTPSLYKPRAPLRPPTAPPSRRLPQVLEDVRAAAIRDVLQPYVFDDTTF